MELESDMRHLAIIVATVALLAAGCSSSDASSDDIGGAPATTAPRSGAVDDLADVRGAVVRIEAKGTFEYPEGTGYNEGFTGSGFFISPDGIAVTNNHVVTGAAFLQVYVDGEDEPRNAKILGVSECSDLAVIDVDGEGYPYLAWSDETLEVGLNVYAAGHPLGDHEYTLLDGIISKEAADGESSWASVDHVIEHTADILPGNSGGPLVTDGGYLVGVNYAGDDSGQAFAIGHAEAQPVIAKLSTGVDVASIGINGTAIYDPDDGSGIWVHSVGSGSPADLLGIRGGDAVTEIEGIIPATDGTMSDYCDVLRGHEETDALQIEVWRNSDGVYLEGTLNTEKILAPVSGQAPDPADGTASGEPVDPPAEPVDPPPAEPADPPAEPVDPESDPDGGDDAVWRAPVVGECMDRGNAEAFRENQYWELTPCDGPHFYEAYAVVELEGGPYPGEESVSAIGQDICLTSFVGYVGIDFQDSAYGIANQYPSEGVWEAGGTTVRCLIRPYEDDADLIGSAYQTNQ